MRALLARDPAFREYQLAMSMFGAGMLSLTPLMVVCLNDVLGLPTFAQVVVTTSLPIIVMPFAVQPWARYLDRHRVVTFRALHGRVTIVAVALLVAAVLLHQPCAAVAGRGAYGRQPGGGQPRLDAGSQRLRAAGRGDAVHGACT